MILILRNNLTQLCILKQIIKFKPCLLHINTMYQYFISFPHIEQSRHLWHKNLFSKHDTINYIGTVKLHGTNLGISEIRSEEPLIVQSRNRVLSLKEDNVKSYEWVMAREKVFRTMFATLRAKLGLEQGRQITIFGEFAGKGIQQGVGISTQQKFFSIFHVFVEKTTFISPDLHQDLHSNEDRIYHVHQFGTYKFSIDKSNMDSVQEYIDKVTDEVGKSCPASAFLGTDGVGEGIVWTPVPIGNYTADYWFKSKCEAFKLAATGKKLSAEGMDNIKFAEDFAKEYFTEARALQGIGEAGKDVRKFIKWCCDDIIREEGQNLTEDQKKHCTKSISRHAGIWFKQYIDV